MIGAVLGGLVLIAAIAGISYCMCCSTKTRRSKSKAKEDAISKAEVARQDKIGDVTHAEKD